jgi:hypothetical protein
LVVVALVSTGLTVNWIRTKADGAVAPVDLPSANPTPMKTVNPSVRPTAVPPPTGKVIGSRLIASNNDTMPLMGSAWRDYTDATSLNGGAAIWLDVHKKYDGTKTWGNYVAFGGLNQKIAYTNTPAGRKDAAVKAASTAIVDLYGQNVKIMGKAVHRQLTVGGHPAHEITVKVDVKVPKLKETFSTVLVTLVDRGDDTADIAVADLAGSTPQWLPIWRTKVSQIQINK